MEKTAKVKRCENRAREGHPEASDTDYEDRNYIDKLSDELLLEILSRIRTCEIATRCKCVSKRWVNLISCPSFTSQFLFHQHDRNSRKPLPFALIARYSDPEEQIRILVYSKDHPTEFGSHGFSFEFLPNYRTKRGERIPMRPFLKAACGDLVVFGLRRERDRNKNTPELGLEIEENYIICNPRTMQWVWLPPFPGGTGRATEVALVCDPFYSFDTHHSRCCLQDSYRYRVFSISLDEHGLERPKLNVFDSETHQWGKLVLSCPQGGLTYILGVPPMAFNGMLHFLTTFKIVAFDPFGFEMGSGVACRFINLPAQCGRYNLAYLGSCSGHLRLSLGHGYSVVRVWDLEDYDKGEWCLKHQISLKVLRGYWNSRPNRKGNNMLAIHGLRVLGFHPYDKDILYLLFPDCIVEYNMRTQALEAGCEFRLGVSVKNNTVVYIMGEIHRVVLPCWPTPLPLLE